MTDEPTAEPDAADDLTASDRGARSPVGSAAYVLLYTALAWTLFQLWIASPLPFMFRFGVFNDAEARSIHLAFAMFLAFTAYPAHRNAPKLRIPIFDWCLAITAAFTAGYMFIAYRELATRAGIPTDLDLIISVVGLILLLEATRRALGPPLMIVGILFICYIFFGDSEFLPELLRWQGASVSKAMSHLWLYTEGVFGIALGVSTSFVFLFVLFGALLERAGAGSYFIKVAFSLLGHMRGGPAKAAVVASAMTGLISGSSIANVVTTGTFTIPLMKRVGFTSEKAGAVEVASSVNGQIMPPVMGAAAFLMVEYVGISYVDVIRHAFLPAVISYIALGYIVHLEALKSGMEGLERLVEKTMTSRLISALMTFFGFVILAAIVYFGIGWIKDLFGGFAVWILAAGIAFSYLALLSYQARFPSLSHDDSADDMLELPPVGTTVKSGLHFLLPVVVLIWCLMVERLSPGLSAFWAAVLLLVILTTQRPIVSFFRGETSLNRRAEFFAGLTDLVNGLAGGARNMVGIGVATATAGIVVGTVSLTGIGLVMTEFVELISGGNIMLMLIFTAVISLILGMGLPTTANYIVVSTLMAPVVVALAAQGGLVLPLIAVHMFVFYFGIMADVTPPVGIASFAAAAVSNGDPIFTGFQAFYYSLRTVVLPFIFIFNTDLLLIDVSILGAVVIFVVATSAILIFAAATQGYFMVKSRYWESLALLLVAFTLFRPGFWLDQLIPPFDIFDATEISAIAENAQDLRLAVSGYNINGDFEEKTVLLPLGAAGAGAARLRDAGLELRTDAAGVVTVDMIGFGSSAEAAGLDFDYRIHNIQVSAERFAKEWLYLPAFLILGGIILLQRRRRSTAGD